MRPLRTLLLCLATASCATAVPAGAPATAGAPASTAEAELPGDTSVLTGTLPNGLTYYVRRNAEPPSRAELRLVVDAGSVLEDDDQLGVAHFLEHMAFNGTRRFQKQALVDYLERIGMRFGPDINAYTSFDETVYMLQLPTDSAGVLETGLDVLEDWATAITLDTAEVRKERGVVMEEWRRRLGAGARVQDRQLPVLFGGSRYAERLPIGDTAVLRSVDAGTLRRFYRDWYRPDLMAVVAVGDFDPERMVEEIRERFGRIPAAEAPRPRPEFAIPQRDSTRFSVVTDPELTTTQVSVHDLFPAEREGTVEEYREGIVESLYAAMLGDRLNEISLEPDAPFLDVSSYRGSFLRSVDGQVLSARAPQGGEARALAALLAEAERAARHGFVAAELERAKAETMRAWERIHAERAHATSGEFAGGYVSHFLYGGRLRTLEDEYHLHRRLLPTITLDEVDARARVRRAEGTRTVLVSAPERRGAEPPTPAALAAVVDSVARAELAPYAEALPDLPLLAALPEPGRVVATDSIPEVGVVRWTLSNGARVVLKPTDLKEDEIFLVGTSPGGTSLLPDSAFVWGRTAVAAVQLGGVGELSLTELQKKLAGKAASVGTSIGELAEQVSGFAAPADAEAMFQLVHLYFTAPRRDSTAWEAYLQRGREALRNRSASPEQAWADTLTSVLSGGHPRARPFTAATYDSLDLDRSLAIFRDRFADAGDFTFYLVGSFHPDSIRPLVERYLASLPATAREESWRDVGMRAPDGVVRRVVHRGVEPKARTRLVFHGPVEFSRETVAELSALAEALQIRLRERLREELGGTYSVGVAGGAERDPVAQYQLAVDFNAAPDRLEELTRVVFEEIESFRTEGIAEDVVVKVREGQRRAREVAMRENSFWIRQLMVYDRYGWELGQIDDVPLSATLTPAALERAARRYLDPERYVQVSLLPER